MAARRCVLHGNFPSDFQYTACPVCGETTTYMNYADPDEFWEENIRRHKGRIASAEEDAELIPVLKDVKVTVECGEYYISSLEVIDAGVSNRLRPHDLVRIGMQGFEILAYSYEKRRYHVQPFSLELSDEDLAKLAGP